MYIPGWYETATLGENGKIDKLKHTRITRIYVSTEASIYNGKLSLGLYITREAVADKHCMSKGRKNWNIPKVSVPIKRRELRIAKLYS